MSAPAISEPPMEYRLERPHITIEFQHGLPSEVGVNGCRVQDVVSVAIERLEQYQRGPLACLENAEALGYLHAAQRSLENRVRRRMEQGVFNTLAPHLQHRTEDVHEDFSATGA